MPEHLSTPEDLGKALRPFFSPAPGQRARFWAIIRRLATVAFLALYAWATVPPGYRLMAAGGIVLGFAAGAFWGFGEDHA